MISSGNMKRPAVSREVELVTLGEAMLRFSPSDHERLEQATSLRIHVGGSELNVAVAATRLGLPARFVTKLTENPLGRMVEDKAREHGVDTSCIVWTDEDRVGTYYLEFGASPRANSVVYDRRHSAVAGLRPGEVDWEAAFAGVRAFHVSGITPALSPTAADSTLEAVRVAREAGVLVCVDLNYRARLWSQDRACEVMTDIARQTDILFATEEDTLRVFGIEEKSYEDVAWRLADTFGLRIVAITLRENPSVWRNRWTAIACETETGTVHTAPTYDIEVVDRVGAGDSFVGGFLYGYLTEGPSKGVRYGVALSAIKQTLPGDLCWATRDEVERVLDGGGLRIVR
jgi:2-dehydro-3-deoxygluconokinase